MAARAVNPDQAAGLTGRLHGERFFMIFKDDGAAVLYAGADKDTPPQRGIVHLDPTVTDKKGQAIRYVLAYPDHPDKV
jgi:hypothetical protein